MSFMDKLNSIKNAGGGNSRIRAVKATWEDPNIQWFFYQGLSPYIHFNMTMTSKDVVGSGKLVEPQPKLIEMLEKIASGELTGRYAKRALKDELAKYTVDFQLYIHSMVNKALRIGVKEGTIEKIAPGFLPIFQLPLAYPVEWARVEYPVLVSPKVDGLRCIYERGKLFTRKGNEIQGLDWLIKKLDAATANYNFKRLDGEIVAPGSNFDEISGKLRSFNETPNAHYYVFDAVVDESVPFNARTTALVSWAHLESTNGFSALPSVTCMCQEEVYAQYDRAIKSGFEGVMIKSYSGCYYNGRSYEWQKVKKHETLDLTVVGIEEGKGRLSTMVGSLICQLPNGLTTRVGTGLSDAQRLLWAQGPSNIIGKTVEVEFMEQSSKGVLRHPRLKCVRGDK